MGPADLRSSSGRSWTSAIPGPDRSTSAKRRRASISSTFITGLGCTSRTFLSRRASKAQASSRLPARTSTNFKKGDRVAYAGPLGGYAEERLIDADRLVKLPKSVSTEQAAGMMLQGMTAQMLLRSVFPVAEGDTILVHAAAGGVGLILCQWAAALGAAVIGTVGTEEKAELARAHGCAHPILYSKQDFVAEVNRITNGEKLPVVYDFVGRTTFLKSLDCLKIRGLMVSFGNASGPPDPIPPNILAQKGSLYLTRPTLFHYIASREQLEQSAGELFEMVSSGKVKIEVKQRFALKDAAEAHRQLEARKTSGSTILTI